MLRKVAQITFFNRQACSYTTGSTTHIELPKKLIAQIKNYRELDKPSILDDDCILDVMKATGDSLLAYEITTKRLMKEDLRKEIFNALYDIVKKSEVETNAASDEKSFKMS